MSGSDGAGGAGAGGEGGAGAGGGGAAGGQQTGGQGGQAGGGASGGAPKPFHADWGLDTSAAEFIAGKGFASPAELVKSALNADKLVRDRNVIPAPDAAKLADWEGWEKMGWTRDPAGYKLADAQVPEGLTYSKDMDGAFAKLAHEARLPPALASQVRDGLLTMLKSEQDALANRGAAETRQLQQQLRQEWGSQYDANMELARRAAQASGINVQDAATLSKLTDAPGVLKLFQRLGESMSEDALKGGGGGRNFNMTPEQAAAEQRKLSADRDFMSKLSDKRHPEHPDVAARWQNLIEIKASRGQR